MEGRTWAFGKGTQESDKCRQAKLLGSDSCLLQALKGLSGAGGGGRVTILLGRRTGRLYSTWVSSQDPLTVRGESEWWLLTCLLTRSPPVVTTRLEGAVPQGQRSFPWRPKSHREGPDNAVHLPEQSLPSSRGPARRVERPVTKGLSLPSNATPRLLRMRLKRLRLWSEGEAD